MKQIKTPNEEQERAFIRETIKPKKNNPWICLGKWLFMALLCGAAAGAVFWVLWHFFPEPEKVSPQTTQEQTSESAWKEELPTVEQDQLEAIRQELSAELKKQISAEIDKQIGQEVETGDRFFQIPAVYQHFRDASLVTVTRIRRSTDWMQNSREHSSDGWGIVLEAGAEKVLVATDNSGLADAAELSVTMKNQTFKAVSVLAQDTVSHVAVLEVSLEGKGLPEGVTPVAIGSSVSLRLGDPLLAVGAPSGSYESLEVGFLSARSTYSVPDNEYTLLYTSMTPHGGSGALINLDGELVGWLTEMHQSDLDDQLTAIGISDLTKVMEFLKNGHTGTRLGIIAQKVPEEVSKEQGVPSGLYITGLEEGSPAAASGILNGDVLVKIDDAELTSVQSLHAPLMQKEPGQQAVLNVMRWSREGYTEITVPVTLGSR